VGQQLSTKAAASINKRLADLLGEAQYAKIPKLEDEALRAVGLSRPKIRYLRALTEAVLTGALPFGDFDAMSDDEVVECLTALPGFGRWSAHMYLLFNLQRPDVWPTGDLAVRVGVSRMLGSSERLSEAEVAQAGEAWRPNRSAVALLAWHFYAKVPAI
jgi:DNA-3-methyladenine glycosylase II